MNQNLNESTSKFGLANEEGINFRSLLNNFWEAKWFILAFTLTTIVFASFYTFFKKPQYESNVLIQVQKNSQGSSGLSSVSQLTGSSIGPDPAIILKALIRSRVILEPAIKKLGLDTSIKAHSSSLLHKKSNVISLSELTLPSTYYNQPLKLEITNPTHFKLFDNENHLLIQGATNKVVSSPDKLFKIQVTGSDFATGTIFDIIKHPSDDVVQSYESALRIEQLGEGAAPTGLLKISLQGSNPQLITTILNTIAEITVEKNAITKSIETANTIEFLSQQIPLVRSSLADAENKLNQYRAKTGKIDIKFETEQLLMQLSAVEKQIIQTNLLKVDLLQKYTSLHPVIIELTFKEKQLQKEKNTLEVKLKALPASDQIAVNLMRDVKVKNDLYLILLGKIQELRVIKAGTTSDVSILAIATPSDIPLPKHTGIVLIASFFLGLLLSCFLVLLRKVFFNYVNDPRWIERNLNILNLAIVPYSREQKLTTEILKANPHKHPGVLAARSPHDLSIEALRSLRTNLQLMLCETTNNIVTILGISPGIGKSFVSINLAYLLSDIGKRVLLIDGDIRKGHLNNYFNVSRAQGLSDVLEGTQTIEQVLHQTTYQNLSFISTGNYPKNPAELLTSSNFKNFVNEVSKQFDIVLIDTAPLLAVTDSSLIAAHAGINFLVVGSDMHHGDEITAAIKRVTLAGVKVNGTIFNNLKKNTTTHGAYHYLYQHAQ